MSSDAIAPLAFDFAVQVERHYRGLVRTPAGLDAGEPSVAGKLLWAGELDSAGRALMVAGNVAGAATLAASGEASAQKRVIREGVADFLVTSLDEALRILKNEIRKHETVSVCVGTEAETVEQEMVARGVLPDLIAGETAGRVCWGQRAKTAGMEEMAPGQCLLAWSVATAPARWLPRLDALALEHFCKGETFEARVARRWMRLAPRYLGRLAQGFRVLRVGSDAVQGFVERARRAVHSGDLGAEVRIDWGEGQATLAPVRTSGGPESGG